MTECRMCRQRGGKTWNGDDPVCAFPDQTSFTFDNWNCATINALRDVANKYESYIPDDDYAALIPASNYSWPEGPFAFVLKWYKHRGRTDMVRMIYEDGATHLPTETDCRRLLAIHGVIVEEEASDD